MYVCGIQAAWVDSVQLERDDVKCGYHPEGQQMISLETSVILIQYYLAYWITCKFMG